MRRFKNILCVVELSATCQHILERAVTLAENNQANLTVINVIETVPADLPLSKDSPNSINLQTAMVNAHEQQLNSWIAPYRERIDIQIKILKGVPFLEIIREVLRNGRDLVIKAPENWDWLDRLFGSDDMHLLRKCPCPVWLIKTEAATSYRRILAAVDIDDWYPPAELKTRRALNLQILEMATSLTLSEFAELHVVHAWYAVGESVMRGAFMRTPEERIIAYREQAQRRHERALDGLLCELGDKLGQDVLNYLKPQIHLVKGWARKEIPVLAKQIKADLIVMGTVARTSVPGFIIGNTAETILNQIDCSVLAIKPPGFATPVTMEN